MVIKKGKKSGILSVKTKPNDLKLIENNDENNNNNIGLLKYHPELNRLLICYPNSNQVYYCNDEKNILLNTHGNNGKIITSIDIGNAHKCASACQDNTINIFSTREDQDKSEIHTIHLSSTPNCLQFNPTQSCLAVGLYNNIKIYTIIFNSTSSNTIKDAHKGQILKLSYSHDGNYLASVGEDLKLKIWDSDKFDQDQNNLQPIHTIQLDCSKEILKKIGISWRPTTNKLSSSSSSIQQIYELTIPTRNSNTIKSIQFDEDDFESKNFKIITFENHSEGHTKEVTSVQWSKGGDYLASIGLDCNLLIWDCRNGDNDDYSLPPIIRYKHTSPIVSISWSLESTNSISFFDSKGCLNTYSNFVEGGEDKISLSIEDDDPNFDFGDDFEMDDQQNEQQSNYSDNENNNGNGDNSNEGNNEGNGNGGGGLNECQDSFQIGSTYQFISTNLKTCNLKTKRYYMAYNMLGFITKREESNGSGEISSIEVDFHETGFHKKIVFSDINQNLRSASMCKSGAVFATKYTQQELDDYEIEQSNKRELLQQQQGDTTTTSPSMVNNSLPISTLLFKSFNDSGSDWIYTDKNLIEGVCVTDNFVISCSENRILRIFSLGGIQLNLLSLPGDLVTMNSFGDTLAIVYHKCGSGVGSGANQFMNVWWLNLINGKQLYHDTLPLSPWSNLSWIGFSDDGLLSTMDTVGMVRQLSNGWIQAIGESTNGSFLQWIPITDLTRCEKPHSQDLYTYWIIGLGKKDIYSIFCCEYPICKQQTHNYVKIELPLLSNSVNSSSSSSLVNEREFLRNKFQLANYLFKENNTISNNSNGGIKSKYEESDATRQIAEIDMSIIRVFSFYIDQGHHQKCVDLCQSLHLKKSLSIAFTISNTKQVPWLSKKIVELIENFKPLNLNPSNILTTTTTTTSSSTSSTSTISPTLSSTSSIEDNSSNNNVPSNSPIVSVELTPPPKSKTLVVNKQPQTFDSDLYDNDQSPSPKKSTTTTTSKTTGKKIPFQSSSKSSSSSSKSSPEPTSKKRKESPASTQPTGKLSKFK